MNTDIDFLIETLSIDCLFFIFILYFVYAIYIS